MECRKLYIKNKLSVENASKGFPEMAIGLLLFQQMGNMEIYDLILEKLRGKLRVKMGQSEEAGLVYIVKSGLYRDN